MEEAEYNNCISDQKSVFNSFPYSIKDVSKMLTHPLVNGQIKLFKFLRNQGVFEGVEPVQQYIDAGYFTVNYDFAIPSSIYLVPRTRASFKGVRFIKQLVFEKLGVYAKPVKASRTKKTGKLTNLNTLLK